MGDFSKGMKAQATHALQADDIRHVKITRTQARTFIDEPANCVLTDQLTEALDDAQGTADAAGKVTFVLIRIEGEVL